MQYFEGDTVVPFRPSQCESESVGIKLGYSHKCHSKSLVKSKSEAYKIKQKLC